MLTHLALPIISSFTELSEARVIAERLTQMNPGGSQVLRSGMRPESHSVSGSALFQLRSADGAAWSGERSDGRLATLKKTKALECFQLSPGFETL